MEYRQEASHLGGAARGGWAFQVGIRGLSAGGKDGWLCIMYKYTYLVIFGHLF